jgi:hypothetical protein
LFCDRVKCHLIKEEESPYKEFLRENDSDLNDRGAFDENFGFYSKGVDRRI